MSREDYIVRYACNRSTFVEELLSASHDTVQAWINDNLLPGQLLHVRSTSLDELARNVTEDFREPYNEDADDRRPNLVAMMRNSGAVGRG